MAAVTRRAQKKNTQKHQSELAPPGPCPKIQKEVKTAHSPPPPQRRPEPHNKT